MLVILFGGLGTTLRYLLNMYFPIFVINIIAVILIARYRGNKSYVTTGFLGGFSSLSAIYIATVNEPFLIILHFIIYYLTYKWIVRHR